MSIWYGWNKLPDESQPPSFVLLPNLPNWSHFSHSPLIPTGTPERTSLKTSFLWCLQNSLCCEAPCFLSLWQMTEIICTFCYSRPKKIHRIKQTQIITQRKDLKVQPPRRIDSIWERRNSNSHYSFLYIDSVYQTEILYLICKYRCYMLVEKINIFQPDFIQKEKEIKT